MMHKKKKKRKKSKLAHICEWVNSFAHVGEGAGEKAA